MTSFDHTATLCVIYNRDGSTTYARTPDNTGFYFYDSESRPDATDEERRKEAEGDVAAVERTIEFNSPREFDEWREENDLL